MVAPILTLSLTQTNNALFTAHPLLSLPFLLVVVTFTMRRSIWEWDARSRIIVALIS